MLLGSSNSSARTPQYSAQRRTTGIVWHSASTGTRGRWPEMSRAMRPDNVGQTTALRSSWETPWTASDAIVRDSSPPFAERSHAHRSYGSSRSVVSAIADIIAIASTG